MSYFSLDYMDINEGQGYTLNVLKFTCGNKGKNVCSLIGNKLGNHNIIHLKDFHNNLREWEPKAIL